MVRGKPLFRAKQFLPEGEKRMNFVNSMAFTAITFVAFTALVAIISWWKTRGDNLEPQDGYYEPENGYDPQNGYGPEYGYGPEAPVKKKKKEKDWIFDDFV